MRIINRLAIKLISQLQQIKSSSCQLQKQISTDMNNINQMGCVVEKAQKPDLPRTQPPHPKNSGDQVIKIPLPQQPPKNMNQSNQNNDKQSIRTQETTLGQSQMSPEQISDLKQIIARLTWFDRQGIQHQGTAFLVSSKFVLTAASNVYNKKFKCENWGFDLYLEGKSTNGVVYRPSKWKYLNSFVKQCENGNYAFRYDYVVMMLEQQKQHPICLKKDVLLTKPCYECLVEKKDLRVRLFRPQSKRGTKIKNGIKSGKVTTVQNGQFIKYHIMSDFGDKGGPIIVDSLIIAINYKCDNAGGIGRLIDQQMIDNINKLLKQLGGEELKIAQYNLCVKWQSEHFQQTKQQESKEVLVENQLKDYLLTVNQRPKQPAIENIPQEINQNPGILNLQTIDLTSKDNKKLTSDSINAFSKIKLEKLKKLKLDNNCIADKGLESLCKNDYPNLKDIEIDNNAVSINGLKHIYFNNWKNDVNYKLYSVSTNDGYQLNVGQNIPLIKSLIKQKDNEKRPVVNLEEKNVQNALKLLLATPLQGQDPAKILAQSKNLEASYMNASKKSGPSVPTVMMQLKKGFGEDLHFTKNAGLKSNVTSNIIFTGVSNQRVGLECDLKGFKQFNPNEFQDNSSRLRQFQKQFIGYITTRYGVDTTDLTLDKVLKNPFRVQVSDSLNQFLEKNGIIYEKMDVKFKNYFDNFQLSEEEFDSQGDCVFPQPQNAQIQQRGGYPYYRPVVGRRFGIRVSKLYENINWLLMDKNKDEWAIGFHGVRFPMQDNKIGSIMKGREKGEMLRAGGGQAYQNSLCLNKKNERVGQGIYFSPYFLLSLFYYSGIQDNEEYHLVLQCRLRPDSIKITPQPCQWVINKSEDARPYGIILFTRQQKDNLGSLVGTRGTSLVNPLTIHKHIYKQEFTGETWRNQYEKQYLQFKNKKGNQSEQKSVQIKDKRGNQYEKQSWLFKNKRGNHQEQQSLQIKDKRGNQYEKKFLERGNQYEKKSLQRGNQQKKKSLQIKDKRGDQKRTICYRKNMTKYKGF